MTTWLPGSQRPLCEMYDVALLDLDGVVYIGPSAVPHAAQSLRRARKAGSQLAFVTNNAARPPDTVAAHLTELGVDASADEVITSAQAAARYLADRLEPAANVLVLGTIGLTTALEERGLTPVDEADDAVAVVQGYSPDMNWRLLAEGAVAINAGALWVATNADPTVPSPRGPLPGNGSLVAALRHATRKEPVVTGKPDPTMHRETLLRTGATTPIVVGDRLDTDIEGANAVGCASLLVLTGVTTPADLVVASEVLRPTYVAADLRGLLTAHPPTEAIDSGGVACGAWTATLEQGTVELAGCGSSNADAHALQPRTAPVSTPEAEADSGGSGQNDSDGSGQYDDDALDALRAICAAAWSGSSNEVTTVRAAEGDDAARAMVRLLGLG